MSSDLGNREIMAKNIQRYLKESGHTRKELSQAINVPYTTVCGWLNARTYPRIDKIEAMSRFFHIQKKDLVESADSLPYTWTGYIDSVQSSLERNADGGGYMSDQYENVDELREILTALRDRSEMKMLFKSAKGATKEQIESIAKLLESFKATE